MTKTPNNDLIAVAREVDGIEMGVLTDGTPYLTQRGLAKACGVDHRAIIRHADAWESGKRDGALARLLQKLGYDEDLLYIPIATDYGPVNAYPVGVCTVILEYYAIDVGNETAKTVYRLTSREGLREFIYRATGYTPRSATAPGFQQLLARYELARVPDGYFSVFREASDFLFIAIQNGLSISNKVIPDISIGLAWGKYWTENNLDAKYGDRRKHACEYPTEYPQAQAGPHRQWIYPEDALGEFRRWLRKVYVPYKYPVYLNRKVDEGLITRADAERLLEAVALARLSESPPLTRLSPPMPITTPLLADGPRRGKTSLLRGLRRAGDALAVPDAVIVPPPAPKRSLLPWRR